MQVANVADEATRILREWSEVRLVEAAAVLAAGFVVSAAIKWTVPRLAERLPYRFRVWVLPWGPILRFIVLLFVLTYVVPLFIHPTQKTCSLSSGLWPWRSASRSKTMRAA